MAGQKMPNTAISNLVFLYFFLELVFLYKYFV